MSTTPRAGREAHAARKPERPIAYNDAVIRAESGGLLIRRAYKLRFYPTRVQERALGCWFGHTRWVWNWALDARRKACARRKDTLTSVDLERTLSRMMRGPSRAWLGDIPREALIQKLRDLPGLLRRTGALPALQVEALAPERAGALRRPSRGQDPGLDRRHERAPGSPPGASEARRGTPAGTGTAIDHAEDGDRLARCGRAVLGVVQRRGDPAGGARASLRNRRSRRGCPTPSGARAPHFVLDFS